MIIIILPYLIGLIQSNASALFATARVDQNKHGPARITYAHDNSSIGGNNIVNLAAGGQLNLRFSKTGPHRNIAFGFADALDNCAHNNCDPANQNYAQRDNHNQQRANIARARTCALFGFTIGQVLCMVSHGRFSPHANTLSNTRRR